MEYEDEIVWLHGCTRISHEKPKTGIIFCRKNSQTTKKEYRFVEFFAGAANASWCLKQFGLAGLSFDVNYGGRYNNIFEPSGFACLSLCYVLVNIFP